MLTVEHVIGQDMHTCYELTDIALQSLMLHV